MEHIRHLENETKKPEAKRLVERATEFFEFYLANQHLLYRPVILLSVVLNAFTLLSMIRLYVTYGVGLDAILMNGSLALYPLVTLPLAILIGFGARRELNAGRAQGITLFAVLMVLNIANWNLLTVIAGCYAVLNSSFRIEWKARAPLWYQKICAEIGN